MSETNGSLFDDLMSIEEAKKLRDANTFREWNEKNKEKRKLYKKEYNERMKEHNSEQYKKWYAENKESKQASAREWKRKNKDRVKEYGKQWFENNKERLNEKARKLYSEDSTRIRAKNLRGYTKRRPVILQRNRERYENNADFYRERNKEYKRNNPIQVRVCNNRRRARKKNAGGSHTHKDIINLLGLQKHKCALCSISLKKNRYHMDHIMPLFLGGSDDISNIQILCVPCNLKKNAKDPIEYNQSLGLLI